MSRILLLFENQENSRVLGEMLERRYELLREPLVEAAFDLAIVDGPALQRYTEYLEARRQEDAPVLCPVLLVTTRRNIGLYGSPLFKLIDEVVLTPIEKLELSARVEMLLRARHLSLELRLRKDDLQAFIHAMTHDLRAPLRTVTGFAETLAEEQASRLDPAGKHQLDRIQAAARQMWELIGSLVEFSRIGRKAIKLRTVDLAEVVNRCIEEMQPEIELRRGDVKIKGELGHAEADATLLKIAVCNLISNGLKYVEKDVVPRVELWTVGAASTTCLMIRDNGIGLKPEDQQRIFTPFVRLHGVEDYPGVGLGLATTRKVVEIMGGQIGVESLPGRGSTFTIELLSSGGGE